MSFHRGFIVFRHSAKRVAVVLLGLGSLVSCGKDQPSSVNSGVITQSLNSDVKRCMDTQINQIIKTSSGDDVKAVNDGFPAALKSCSMSDQQKSQYLAYTNVLAGVTPDSVGDEGFSELKTVVGTQNYRRGTIEELFSNGWVVVRWDGDLFSTTVKQSEISAEVLSRAGVHALVEVIATADGRRAFAQEVYAMGLALVKFDGQPFGTMVRTSDISPRVDCLNGMCTRSDVIHNTTLRRGFLTAIYANSMARVRWNGDSFDTVVNLREVSGRLPR